MLEMLLALVAAVLLGTLGIVLVARWGQSWGATPAELSMTMPGDAWLESGPPARVRMTRAVTIDAPRAVVWRWLSQVGRGAGWHSLDRVDNGGRASARHVVSWIPEPAPGDATAIGYLRHLDPGRALAWWTPDSPLLGARIRSVFAYCLHPDGESTRLIERFTWDAAGSSGWAVLRFFQAIDTIMAIRQLINLKQRIERCGSPEPRAESADTGAHDQYQLYHVIYAGGGQAGVAGRERAADWHRAAIRDGVLPAAPGPRQAESLRSA